MFYDWNVVIYTYYMQVNHITVTNVVNYFSSETDKSNGKDDIEFNVGHNPWSH